VPLAERSASPDPAPRGYRQKYNMFTDVYLDVDIY
jgi:hypothetical protein